MSFNKRLRRKLDEKGSSAAEKWEKQRCENARKFDPVEFQKAADENERFHEQNKGMMVSR